MLPGDMLLMRDESTHEISFNCVNCKYAYCVKGDYKIDFKVIFEFLMLIDWGSGI